MSSYSLPNGTLPTGRRRARNVFTRVAKVTAMLTASIAIGLLGTGGTYAFLNASASGSSAGVMQAGTASLAVSPASIALTNMYPGQTRTGTFTVTNTGNVDLALFVESISGLTSANGLVATVARDSCGGTQQTAGGTLGIVGKNVGVMSVCLTVSMPANAPDSARTAGPSTVTVVISGTQS